MPTESGLVVCSGGPVTGLVPSFSRLGFGELHLRREADGMPLMCVPERRSCHTSGCLGPTEMASAGTEIAVGTAELVGTAGSEVEAGICSEVRLR